MHDGYCGGHAFSSSNDDIVQDTRKGEDCRWFRSEALTKRAGTVVVQAATASAESPSITMDLPQTAGPVVVQVATASAESPSITMDLPQTAGTVVVQGATASAEGPSITMDLPQTELSSTHLLLSLPIQTAKATDTAPVSTTVSAPSSTSIVTPQIPQLPATRPNQLAPQISTSFTQDAHTALPPRPSPSQISTQLSSSGTSDNFGLVLFRVTRTIIFPGAGDTPSSTSLLVEDITTDTVDPPSTLSIETETSLPAGTQSLTPTVSQASTAQLTEQPTVSLSRALTMSTSTSTSSLNHPTDLPAATSSLNTLGRAIGGSLAGVVVVIAAIVALIFVRRRLEARHRFRSFDKKDIAERLPSSRRCETPSSS
ncbi:hypothetical protein HGRIS_009042 [Hohenbuehelia grisea]|uniref:Uncharacterized protein n=1 Tax=Hohenbuehelia grisea TaxID=104357 RepID=A0ABR3IZY3_9AGAR